MVPFAGYEMPLHYPAGLLKEHLHTRAAAGLFDVSHMGQITVAPRPGGDLADVARALEALLPIDVLGLKPNRQRYGLFTNEAGGILDDLMVANLRRPIRSWSSTRPARRRTKPICAPVSRKAARSPSWITP